MREWLQLISEPAIVIIDAIALVIVAVGTVEALVRGLHIMLTSASAHARREVWLRYARWLVAALTFQLAADIIETSITTDWQAIARLGAIAVIRTFLNFFLERDVTDLREREEASRAA